MLAVMSSGDESSRGDEPGGEASFADLYASVLPSLVAWANLRVPSRLRRFLEPADVVQDVTYRAFSKFDRYDASRAPFRHWFFGVANNVLRETFARLARVTAGAPREPSSSGALAEVPEDVTSISKRAARDEGLKRFVARLETLDDDKRKLLIYRGIEGLGHAEVAELLGTTRDAVEKRWQRLVQELEDLRPPPDLFAR
jgi:RNA polymerase sigma factor (sigma-70 family)